MENKMINLEEIIQQCVGIRPGAKNTTPMDYYECKYVMLEFGKKLLELAAENACLLDNGRKLNSNRYTIEIHDVYYVETEIEISRQSILDTINQVVSINKKI